MTYSYDLGVLENKRILVVGDVMLDRYLWGDVERISPEAPVPVFHVKKQSEIPGGAGNVVSNLVGLGALVTVVGIRGEDEAGDRLDTLLKNNTTKSHLLIDATRPTITKTRIVSQGQQMLRIDEENILPLDSSLQTKTIESIKAQLENFDAIILSDYGKGMLEAKSLVQYIINLARESDIPLLVDPKGKDWDKYRGATCITPNTKELETLCRETLQDEKQLVEAMQGTILKYDLAWLVVTRGPLGMCLMNRNEAPVFITTLARQVYDVSGAGDTAIATLAMCVGSGFTFPDAARVANLAAGIVVGKVGTQPISLSELTAALRTTGVDSPINNVTRKICSLSAAIVQAQAWKSARELVVFTNGCFDLLHPGHVHLLHKARNLGDRLVVAINSDASVRRLKGSNRPILTERDRASLLASLDCVDLVLIFESNSPEELLSALRPHILAKGADYREEQVLGRKIVESYGGQVRLIPVLDGYSTSGITSKLLEAHLNTINKS
jgi:D-beta-D-heptose 7-phosphate kinase/D-beta-D-heptose 1-phosphate adenosyltransferase